MLNQQQIEESIRHLQKLSANIGFEITELIVRDPKLIKELEKCRLGFGGIKLKPHFVSSKNYKRIRLPENCYGMIYGIRLMKIA